ncbi:very short patch repair endonuclease [uncultured Desulfobacter sp.]|uniref:very short patch repair endonuclease n=1 Tax=uncultured Desulfobacter sp. TaxID=240139 RepID=UPI0029C85B9B|nr:very short patch repair endonuclease [uncultured Desulfobacter sp.]
MDVHQPQTRSYNMSRIRGKDTKPELIIRRILWSKGYRYRIHYKNLPGKPDIVFPRKKKVIFINGCFWHRHNCKYFKWPKSNQSFWKEKILRTVNRDSENYNKLISAGWGIYIIWECSIKNNLDAAIDDVMTFLSNTDDGKIINPSK